MGGSYFGQAGDFLVETLVSLYATAVLLRFLLQWVRADFYNPVSQALVKVTNPALRPLRRLIPGWAGIDIAALVLMLAILALGLFARAVMHGVLPGMVGLLLLAFADLVALTLRVFILVLILQAVISLVSPMGARTPMGDLLWRLSFPLLSPVQRWVPPVAGLDFSPLVVIIGLQLLQILVAKPLSDLALRFL